MAISKCFPEEAPTYQAIAATSLDADVYENWTDVSGILMVDPRIVENPKSIARVTYARAQRAFLYGSCGSP